MRNRILIATFFLTTLFLTANNLYAQQSGCYDVKSIRGEHLDPETYAELRENAPEQLQVDIVTFNVWRNHRQNTFNKKFFPYLPPVLKSDEVTIEATVKEVKKTQSGLKRGDTINIYYITNQNYEVVFKGKERNISPGLKNWEAINPLLMEVNKQYTVFVKRVQVKSGTDADDGFRYVPVAYSKSFEEIIQTVTNR